MQIPLELQHAGTTKSRDLERLLVLNELFQLFWDVDGLKEELSTMQYSIAVRAREIIKNPEVHRTKEDAYRVVGALWGRAMHIRGSVKKVVDSTVFELHMVSTDPAYTGAAEWWMMDQLKSEMPSNNWSHLVVVSAMDEENGLAATFARRQNFVPKDVKHDLVFWQWPADEEGIQPPEPKFSF